MESITYKSHVEPIVENGIVLQRLTVQAIDNESVVYTLSLDLEEIRWGLMMHKEVLFCIPHSSV